MTKLKLADIQDDNPVKLTIMLSAPLHRDLTAYAKILASDTGIPIDPAKLIVPMLERFILADSAFQKARRQYSTNSIDDAIAKLNR
jgi:hypothetical protein